MTMKYEDKICDFLAEKENLPIAMEIADNIDKVIQRIANGFWERVRAGLQRSLEEGGLHGGWCQELDKGAEGLVWGIFLYPKVARDPRDHFRYRYADMSGQAARHHLYQGILLPRTVPRAARSAVGDLRESLLEEGYRGSKSEIGWKYVRDFASVNEFVLTISDRGDEFASGVAENFWDFFEARRADVQKLNAALPACRKKASKPG